MITVLRSTKLEWARMAQVAYSTGHNWTGHRFSGLASIPEGTRLPASVYDTAMDQYRNWLCFNEYPEGKERA